MVAIDVAKCPFETIADKRAHRPGFEGLGRRTIDEQHGGRWLEMGRAIDDIGQDLLLALRVVEVGLMLRQRMDRGDPDQQRCDHDKYQAPPLAEEPNEEKARDADRQCGTDGGIEEYPPARVPPYRRQVHCEPWQNRDHT